MGGGYVGSLNRQYELEVCQPQTKLGGGVGNAPSRTLSASSLELGAKGFVKELEVAGRSLAGPTSLTPASAQRDLAGFCLDPQTCSNSESGQK